MMNSIHRDSGRNGFAGQIAEGLPERASMQINVGLGSRGRHQRHIVKRRQQNAAIERVEMQESLERKSMAAAASEPLRGRVARN